MKTEQGLGRRTMVRRAAAAGAIVAAPAILHAQAATLKITTWGGKWGDTMKSTVIPAFEAEHKCKVEVDSAFPYMPKLQASPRSNPVYDVLHANTQEQWQCLEQGLVAGELDRKAIPNIADVYPYAISDKIVGVSIFTSAVGLAYRTDKGIRAPTSWKDLADPAFAGQRGGYIVPVNSLGQMHLMMLGKVYGKGFEDLDAAYKALEQLKPIKLVDFTGGMEKMLLAGEVVIGVLHDSGVFRYDDQKPPLEFAAPSEGVVALEQVLNLTAGTPRKELGNAYINYMLRPDVQKTLSEAVWYSPSNRKVKLEPRYDARLYTTEEKVSRLIQMPWKWYNARKDEVDARVTRLMRG